MNRLGFLSLIYGQGEDNLLHNFYCLFKDILLYWLFWFKTETDSLLFSFGPRNTRSLDILRASLWPYACREKAILRQAFFIHFTNESWRGCVNLITLVAGNSLLDDIQVRFYREFHSLVSFPLRVRLAIKTPDRINLFWCSSFYLSEHLCRGSKAICLDSPSAEALSSING